ncbi:MAG: hypothetical protein R2710_12505 [Acidimicrobiales bacterium]
MTLLIKPTIVGTTLIQALRLAAEHHRTSFTDIENSDDGGMIR